jgi:hypothetical protein
MQRATGQPESPDPDVPPFVPPDEPSPCETVRMPLADHVPANATKSRASVGFTIPGECVRIASKEPEKRPSRSFKAAARVRVPLGPPFTSQLLSDLLAVSGYGWLVCAGGLCPPNPPEAAARVRVPLGPPTLLLGPRYDFEGRHFQSASHLCPTQREFSKHSPVSNASHPSPVACYLLQA